MAKAARQPRAGVSYVTFSTHEQQPIFDTTRVASLFIETLLHYRTLSHYKLHAYVVLPHQVHLLLTPQNITLDQAIHLIKAGFAHLLNTASQVWEESFSTFSVANIHDLEVVRAYLHQLPVQANIVSAAELYPHSSAFRTTLPMPLPAEAHPAATPHHKSDRKPSEATAVSETTLPHLRKVAS